MSKEMVEVLAFVNEIQLHCATLSIKLVRIGLATEMPPGERDSVLHTVDPIASHRQRNITLCQNCSGLNNINKK